MKMKIPQKMRERKKSGRETSQKGSLHSDKHSLLVLPSRRRSPLFRPPPYQHLGGGGDPERKVHAARESGCERKKGKAKERKRFPENPGDPRPGRRVAVDETSSGVQALMHMPRAALQQLFSIHGTRRRLERRSEVLFVDVGAMCGAMCAAPWTALSRYMRTEKCNDVNETKGGLLERRGVYGTFR